MINKNRAGDIIKKLLSFVPYEADVNIDGGENSVTRFAGSEISQNISTEDAVVTLTVYDGLKQASCSTNVTSGDGLKKISDDVSAMLASSSDGEFEYEPGCNGEVNENKKDCELNETFGIKNRAEIISRQIKKLSSEYFASGALSLNKRFVSFGNKRGAFRYSEFDEVRYNTVITHINGESGGGGCIGYNACPPDTDAAFDEAYTRAKMARDPVSIEPGQYTVILSPAAAADLLTYIVMPICAKWLTDGDSYAAGQLGKQFFGRGITLCDDAANNLTRPLFFDYEGSPRKTLKLIEKGVIENYLHDTKTARRMKTGTTGHAVTHAGDGGYAMNIVMQPGSTTIEDMIGSTERGLYISELHYTNYVNPRALLVTGLTRNGTFLIKDGKLCEAVTNMRFTQNLKDAFNNVTAAESKTTPADTYYSATIAPSLRIEGFCFTGKS
ncbi:MAG: TldD/PmbA family protein [Defluviitaleaceae bacterium]|nr:TldD/PmbA family protein [Defluviitaleaceae bacterium]